MDTSEKAGCHPMPQNDSTCPASFNHQIVGSVNNANALVMVNLQAVKLQVAVADFVPNTPDQCKTDLLEYACSNTLMNCVKMPKSKYGFFLTYNVSRTKQACDKVKKSCPQPVQASSIFNCSVIQTDPFEYANCTTHTNFTGDICPNTNYMVKYNIINSFIHLFMNLIFVIYL